MTSYFPEGRLIDMPFNIAAVKNAASLSEAAAKGQILEARVSLCDTAHNLIVDLGAIKGIIPREEGAIGIAEGIVRDIALISRVNKPVCFTVTELRTDESGNAEALLSRRAAQERCVSEYVSALRPGDIIDARVTHLESFGAFCDIGCGIVSLIPIDAISVSRISHPRDRFRPGSDIRTIVRAIEPDGKISLTHKELLGTWEENASQFQQGETVSGIVRSVEEYGIFVELTPNLAGLAEPKEGVAVGQRASVFIKSILPNKMKLKLIIIDAFDAEATPIPPKYYFDGSHMERFVYSPEESFRVVETVF